MAVYCGKPCADCTSYLFPFRVRSKLTDLIQEKACKIISETSYSSLDFFQIVNECIAVVVHLVCKQMRMFFEGLYASRKRMWQLQGIEGSGAR